jgi:hypothetical protein
MVAGIMRKVKLGHWVDSRTGRAHALAQIDRPWKPAAKPAPAAFLDSAKGYRGQ